MKPPADNAAPQARNASRTSVISSTTLPRSSINQDASVRGAVAKHQGADVVIFGHEDTPIGKRLRKQSRIAGIGGALA